MSRLPSSPLSMARMSSFKRLAAVVAGLAVFAVASTDIASAKVGGSSSMGSRGTRTYSAPPATNTVPRAAAPIQRSITQPSATAAAANVARPSMFGGFKGLLLGGLMAGALASIFGVGALASMLGFVLQAALIGGLVFLAYNFFMNRRNGKPAMATSSSNSYGGAPRPQPTNAYRATSAATGGGAALTISPDDFNTFERLLSEIQLAYGRGDRNALATRTTTEMLTYFTNDLSANTDKGIRNEISDPKLLQGDLSEAWQEAGGDYATVAMRFSLVDRNVEIASGRVVSGSATTATESSELWTFRRPVNGRPNQWTLSAIQQA